MTATVITKAALIDEIAATTQLTKADVGRVLSAFTDGVTTHLVNGDNVTLTGFGTFKAVEREARTGRNPSTGAALEIAAKRVPRFTVGATFAAAVNVPKKKSRK